MAALNCDICGGKLIGKAGGIFECDSCGMEYDTSWAKAKIQEIKGTVKVEGTVEVQGSVKIEGPVTVDATGNADNLIKRGEFALKDRQWDKAKEFFDQALNIREESWEAYLGLCMAEKRSVDRQAYETYCIRCGVPANGSARRLRELAPPEVTQWLQGLDEQYRRKTEAEEREKAEKARQQLAYEERVRAESKARLEPIRNRIRPAAELLAAGASHTVCVTEKGDSIYTGQIFAKKWHELASVAAAAHHTIGLRKDGTVRVHVTNTGNPDLKYAENWWSDIIKVAAGDTYSLGLREDGTVTSIGLDQKERDAIGQWENIVDIAAGNHGPMALTADGKVLTPWGKKTGWTDIVSIAVGDRFAAGLTAYGTVRVSSEYTLPNCDYVAIAAGKAHLLGLRADGTVDAEGDGWRKDACEVSSWSNIVAIAAGEYHSVGIREDGTVVAAGKPWGLSDFGQCAVGGWRLFQSYDSYLRSYVPQKERKAHLKKEQKRLLEAEKADILEKLPTLKGLLAGTKKKQMEARLAKIESELRNL